MIVNLAERAHNHNWELDPIVRSLLDTDFYKLLMLQFIWKHFSATKVSWSLVNRTEGVRVAETVSRSELLQQLEHVRSLRFHRSELVWLAGNTFYGTRGIFSPAFLDWLEHDFRLCDFELTVEDGQFCLKFEGLWPEATMWEIYSLSIINELRTRVAFRGMSEFALDILYARAKAKLWGKIERLRGVPGLKIADFGTRRRHSFLWQEYVVRAMGTALGDSFSGTSNTYLAYKHDLEAVGTNAHELPMALAALANNADELKTAQYRVLEMWQETYQGEILIMLPDTFGTTQFLANAPDWVAGWTGQRIDSKDPFVAGDEYIEWLKKRGRDPRQKRIIASDGLDVDEILSLHAYFSGRISPGLTAGDFKSADDFNDPAKWTADRRARFSAGWGTLLTNDFRGCPPDEGTDLDPISLVCKLTEANGRPAVKLSDNLAKALGPTDEIERYRKLFGTAGITNVPVLV
ncbi:MAG TPA: nicotinate phosphoribosyltransferase [Acidobacteriaceae bacterium]